MHVSKRKPAPERDPAAVPTTAVRIARLPTFKLDLLNSMSAKHGELLYQRLFGLRAIECRALGVVAHHGPVTLKQASIELGIDKGQASRLVTQLLANGLLERHDDPADQRSFFLLLSPAGRRLHDRVAVAAAARNEEWLQGLPEAQRALFVECLDQLSRHTQRMLHEESARSASPQPPLPLRERGEGAAVPERPVIVQPQALRDLQRQLAVLLGEADIPAPATTWVASSTG
jgi:DNA-binding MarR family transcriptional regulator